MGKSSEYWPFHRAQTLLVMDDFGIGEFKDMSDIIVILLRKSRISSNLIYKNMYSLHADGFVTFKSGSGRKSSISWALTRAGADEAAIIRSLLYGDEPDDIQD